ncbi:MAG: hypothetical protein IPJ19_06775 [Planctomycetes bacterium]|nr:hypothetical protein [Planctomycetota bacterium]
MAATNPIYLIQSRMPREQLASLLGNPFKDMVKFVADIERHTLAVGGELHVDAEAELLERGSNQSALWGGNYFPGRGPAACLQYTAMVNLRPSQGNSSMEVVNPALRERIRALVFELLGEGEALS